MITWMQKHRKYLVVTIWISTIAFIGAGFVGWGQYSYGDKASAIAKVGDVEITSAQYQKAYSRLYTQYNQLFQGKFDQEQAKSFGLNKQAFEQLRAQALILNYSNELGIVVSDKEVFDIIKQEDAFKRNGAFDATTYKMALKQVNLTPKEYENELRRSITLEKTLTKFTPKSVELESEVLNTALYIADKIEYKIITADSINVAIDEKELQSYYETHKHEYMSDVAYDVSVVIQEPLTTIPSDEEIKNYHTSHKHDFKKDDGTLETLDEAKDAIIAALNDKATNKAALKRYIDFKKGKLKEDVKVEKAHISASNNPYGMEVLTSLQNSSDNSYIKPKKFDNKYVIIKLEKTIPSIAKPFSEVKAQITEAYTKEKRHTKLLELAKKSAKAFKGKTSSFVTREDISKFDDIDESEAAIFLNALFEKREKEGYIELSANKVVLYSILEQKLLDKKQIDQENSVLRLKNAMFNEGLIKLLDTKYKTEVFAKGL